MLAVVEIAAGTVTMLIKPQTILNIVDIFTADELAENPHDFVASHLVSYAHQLAFSPHFLIGAFVLVDGLLKFTVVVLLLREKTWAYPFAIGVLALFACYEFFRFMQTHSILLILLVVFDVLIVGFVWREYTVVRLRFASARRV